MSIFAYTLRRVLYAIPILLGVCLIIFFLFNVVSPDPALVRLGKHATQKQIEEIREEMGLNRHPVVQYLDIVKSAFTFEYGRSWQTRQEISEMILRGAPASLSLSLPGFILSTLISIIIALVVSYFRGTLLDRTTVIGCVAMMSISSLVYILFFQYYFGYKLGLFEISGYEQGFPDFVPYVALPIVIWIVLSIGPDVRFYRTIMLDEVFQDYVRTARAKGLGEPKIFLKHILKNAMIPIITFVVIQIPFLILGALLLESFFGIPGLGGITISAVFNSDFPVLKAMSILSAVAYIIFNIITDILYTVVDPRVTLK